MYDKSGMSLLQSGTKWYRLQIEPCNLTIGNNLFKNIGDKWQKERRDANYILPPFVENYDRLLNFHWIFNGIYFVIYQCNGIKPEGKSKGLPVISGT